MHRTADDDDSLEEDDDSLGRAHHSAEDSMAEHSRVPITLTIDGEPRRFARITPKIVFQAIQTANDRERETALKLIPANSVEERIRIFRETGHRWSLDNLAEAVQNPDIIIDCLWLAYAAENPGISRDDFVELLGHMDVAMLTAYFNELTGVNEDSPNSTRQAAEQADQNKG